MICSSCGAKVADGTAFCGSCGRPIVGFSVGQAAPVVQSADMAIPLGAVPRAVGAVVYAGFWLRVVAAIIDGLILGVPFAFITFLLIVSALPFIAQSRDPMTIIATMLPRIMFLAIIYIVGTWLYWSLMESSSWQATLGKKALGLQVTDMAGSRPTFGRTSGRFFAGRGIGIVPYLGALYFLISCIVAGFTERKQALHDMIANCLVVRSA